MPCIVIEDSGETIESFGYEHAHRLEISVEGCCSGSAVVTNLRKVAGDMQNEK